MPEHLLVFGGSYIALEFGQMFRRFGSKVTIIQRSAHLLSREDTDIADEVANILREDGIEILLESSVTHVGQNLNGSIEMAVRTAGDEQITYRIAFACSSRENTQHRLVESRGSRDRN